MKIGSVVVEKFGEIGRFLQYYFFSVQFQKYKFLTPQSLALLDQS